MRRPLVAIPPKGPSFVKLLLTLLPVGLLFLYGFLEYFSQLLIGGYNLLFIIVASVFDNFIIVMIVLLQDLNLIDVV